MKMCAFSQSVYAYCAYGHTKIGPECSFPFYIPENYRSFVCILGLFSWTHTRKMSFRKLFWFSIFLFFVVSVEPVKIRAEDGQRKRVIFCTNIENNNDPTIASLWVEHCTHAWGRHNWLRACEFCEELTDHIQIGNLTFHRIGVDLTHIPSLVRFFDIPYFEYPGAFFCVRYYHSVIFRDYVRLYGENCLRIDTQPRNLNGNQIYRGREQKKKETVSERVRENQIK